MSTLTTVVPGVRPLTPDEGVPAGAPRRTTPTGHESHRPYIEAGIEWLERAQDAVASGGISRGFALVHHQYLNVSGWEPAYPETTGYIIPTLYAAAHYLDKPSLLDRARRAAKWERQVQLSSGAVRGGVIGQPVAPAVFNTGQVIFGWLCNHTFDGDAESLDSARRAGQFLVDALDDDGIWRRASSPYAAVTAPLYNARTAWALAEAGRRLGEPRFRDAAARALYAVAKRQQRNAWFPDCCLTDAARPLVHTIAYTIRGLLEGGRVLADDRLITCAERAAEALASQVDAEGKLAGRYDCNWRPTVTWSCLTGNAQMANIWMRLAEINRDQRWLAPVPRVLKYLKSTQNLVTGVAGLRGGILGSTPVDGGYCPNETLSWATKFYVDALMRHERFVNGTPPVPDPSLILA